MISSLNNKIVKEIRKLSNASYARKSDHFMVEGFTMLEEALRTGADIEEVLVSEAYAEDLYRNFDISGTVVSEDIIKKLSQTVSGRESIALVKKRFSNEPLSDLIIYLEDISDPGNLGTIIRTADAFGIKDVVTSHQSVDFYNDKVVRSSMGSVFRVNLRSMDLDDLKSLKEDGYKIVGTLPHGKSKKIINGKTIVAFGNESKGLSDELVAMCDDKFTIPMRGDAESLNLGVAAGILMYIFTEV